MARPAIPEASRRRFDDTVERLRALLPDGWRAEIVRRTLDSGVVSLVADDGTETEVTVLPRERLEPRDLDRLPLDDEPSLVSAGWLSPRSRELLRARQVSYLDRTGNAEVRLRQPALYVRTDGATRDPAPKAATGPTLRGPKAWALLRTLIEVLPPYTAGDLAAAVGVDDGYVSRVLQVLTDERLIVRRPRGPVTDVDWEPLLRQVTSSYGLFRSNETSTWVAGAGPDQLLADLVGLNVRRWAATGSFPASSIESVAAPTIAVVYAEDPERVAKEVRLLPATSGGNVVLARPYDPIVFTRGWDGTDFPCVSVAQIALDSLTGSARMPAEGEAVVNWMRRNERRWRSPSLRG
jgi:hypothetical protein